MTSPAQRAAIRPAIVASFQVESGLHIHEKAGPDPGRVSGGPVRPAIVAGFRVESGLHIHEKAGPDPGRVGPVAQCDSNMIVCRVHVRFIFLCSFNYHKSLLVRRFLGYMNKESNLLFIWTTQLGVPYPPLLFYAFTLHCCLFPMSDSGPITHTMSKVMQKFQQVDIVND